MHIPDMPEALTGPPIVRARHEQSATPVRILFIEDLSRLIGKTPTSIRTFATNKKYKHLNRGPFKLPHARRLCWYEHEVLKWIDSTQPAIPPPPGRRDDRRSSSSSNGSAGPLHRQRRREMPPSKNNTRPSRKLTRREKKLIDKGLANEERVASDGADGTIPHFMAQAMLPLKDPGTDINHWGRGTDKLGLTVISNPRYGRPWGMMPRLLMAWM